MQTLRRGHIRVAIRRYSSLRQLQRGKVCIGPRCVLGLGAWGCLVCLGCLGNTFTLRFNRLLTLTRAGAGAKACIPITPCPLGAYSNQRGAPASSCDFCLACKLASAKFDACSDCSPGYYSNETGICQCVSTR
jgi:hypothetical protein